MAKSKIQLTYIDDGHKEIIFDIMVKNGIDKIMVYFDGGGDDGGINEMEVINFRGQNVVRESWLAKFKSSVVEGARIKQHRGWHNGKENFSWKENVTIEEIIYDICYRVLNGSFGGWENDDGSCGDFMMDSKTRKITLTMKQRYYEYDVSEHMI